MWDRFAAQLLRPINPSVIIILGIFTIVWGLWVASPFWTVFTQAPLYAVMARLGDEVLWGFWAVINGTLVCRGAFKPSYDNLRIGAFAGFLQWFTITIMYFWGDWTSTGGITTLFLAIYAALIWLNVKQNKAYFSKLHSYPEE